MPIYRRAISYALVPPEMALTEINLAKLREVGVSTLTTCLYRRGIRSAYLHGVLPVQPGAARMVGEAFTLRFMPAREDDGTRPDADGPGGNLHQRAFAECPPGHVLVMDAHGERGGCSCGDLLVAWLQQRGVAGVVTDGGFRDFPAIEALNFPAFHAGAAPPPSFLKLRAVSINEPIGCAGIAIYPGDVLVGDREGVVVIPAAIANEVAEEAYVAERYDAFVSEQIRRGRGALGLYPPTPESRAEFATWCAETGAHHS
jgi:regulator of RNase E activity RraA